MAAKLKMALVGLMALLGVVMASGSALAFNPLSTACGTATNSTVCQQADTQGNTNPVAGPNGLISKAANIIALVAGIAAVVVIIISGFLFITAGGTSPGQRSSDPNRLKSARSALSGAIIGLIVVGLAWAIVKIVTTKFVQ